MPFHRERYPAHWDILSASIRSERAGNRCECTGECGLHRTHPGPRRCTERNREPAQWAKGRIILTVAHLCACDPLCADPAHLLALCQRCHLRLDSTLHAQHAAETRRARREMSGQFSFFLAARGAKNA
jgi:hypothetical protein